MGRYRVVNYNKSQVDSRGRLLPRDSGGGDYVLPTASASRKGGVRIGERLTMVGEVLSAVDMYYDDTAVQAAVLDLNAEVQALWDAVEGGGGGDLTARVDALEEKVYGDVDSRLNFLEFQEADFQTRLTDVEADKQPLLESGVNIKTVGGESILGEGDIPLGGGGDPYVLPPATTETLGGVIVGDNLTVAGGVLSGPAPYDDSVVLGAIMDVEEQVTDVRDGLAATDVTVAGKQDTLVSGTNIKTVGGVSILGAGDIPVSGGGGGSGVVPATPDTVAQRGSVGELFAKAGVGVDSVVNRGLLEQQFSLMDPIGIPHARLVISNRLANLSLAQWNGAITRATRLSPQATSRFVEVAQLQFVVDTEVPIRSNLFRITDALGTGWGDVLPRGFAVQYETGAMYAIEFIRGSTQYNTLRNSAALPPGIYSTFLNPGVFPWVILPS